MLYEENAWQVQWRQALRGGYEDGLSAAVKSGSRKRDNAICNLVNSDCSEEGWAETSTPMVCCARLIVHFNEKESQRS